MNINFDFMNTNIGDKMKKKIFLTGAGSGLGKEAAVALARRGHEVYASVHYECQIEELEEIAKKEKLNLQVFKLDILIAQEREKVLDYDIDVLICNAAIGDSGSVAEVFVDRIEKVFETNVFANLRLLQLVLQRMIKQKGRGRIIILSSQVGRIPMPFLSPYCASKFALEAFATCLRQEMKMLTNVNIEICLIEPGAYATGFNKENNEKKYQWMDHHSYFKENINKIQKIEKTVWNFLEQKPYDSIIKKYVKAVEAKKPKFRYTAPWWQAMGIQLGRIIGK